jgi:hypothetical protein
LVLFHSMRHQPNTKPVLKHQVFGLNWRRRVLLTSAATLLLVGCNIAKLFRVNANKSLLPWELLVTSEA